MSDPHETVLAPLWAPVASWTARVAGVFVVVVLAILGWTHANRLVKDPLDSDHFRALKVQLVELKKIPANPETSEKIGQVLAAIREEDLRLRQEYFRQRRLAAHGAWLLLGGMGIFLVAAKSANTLQRKLPSPEPSTLSRDLERERARFGRFSLAGLSLLLAGGMVAVNLGSRSELTATLSSTETPGANLENTDLPSREEFLKNWPAFRGFTGSGISPFDNLPTRWDIKTGEGIAWRSPVPLEGHSSPVIWKNRLFLTGASREQHQVYCFDTSVGTLLWTRDVPGTPKASFKVDDLNGYASPTPATDGRFLYVSFATGDLAALDFSGKVIWTRSLGIPKNEYGHATSLRVYKNLLLVQYDQGSTAKEGLSRFLALNTANGQTVWEVKRPVPNSWATPIVVEVQGRDQIITCGDPWAIAYDATDGKEIWRANCLKQDMTPSPVFADGILIVALAHRSASALHVDGQGDVTNSKILWSEEESLPDTTSPLIVGSQVLFLTTHGARLTSRDLKTGKLAWELEIEGEFKASPSLVGKFVYLFSWDGKAYVIEPGPDAAKVVFSTNMEDKFSASPAFQEGRLFVRGQKELFCIGKKR